MADQTPDLIHGRLYTGTIQIRKGEGFTPRPEALDLDGREVTLEAGWPLDADGREFPIRHTTGGGNGP